MNNPNNKFPDSFREFLVELNNAKVEYMLIGGFAVGAYGHIRATSDMDIFVNASEENAHRLIKASIAYGIPEDSLKIEMFLVPKMVAIGQPPLKIEILKKLDTVDFEYAYSRAKSVVVDNVSIKVVSLDDLILLKKAAVNGREKARDSEDLNFLTRLKSLLRHGKAKKSKEGDKGKLP